MISFAELQFSADVRLDARAAAVEVFEELRHFVGVERGREWHAEKHFALHADQLRGGGIHLRDVRLLVEAGTVAEALQRADETAVDLVVSDIGLPDGDGYSLMERLRDKHGLTGIALSGSGMEQDIARGRAAGFTEHLIKPVNVESLDRVLRAWKEALL